MITKKLKPMVLEISKSCSKFFVYILRKFIKNVKVIYCFKTLTIIISFKKTQTCNGLESKAMPMSKSSLAEADTKDHEARVLTNQNNMSSKKYQISRVNAEMLSVS